MVVQGRWLTDSTLLQAPGIDERVVSFLHQQRPSITLLPELMHLARVPQELARLLQRSPMDRCAPRPWIVASLRRRTLVDECVTVAGQLPQIDVRLAVRGAAEGDECVLDVQLQRAGSGRAHAHAPAFSKQIDESWFLVLGDVCGCDERGGA